ncbi:trans-sulfuration enzyme family protein [Cellulomonas bogoriensis]|uniref:homocysteine desulfhydrase n=1 Tax=Cellulomonas bogoriensis 69B4 = DSM 16987 TaxID=1386082 RepID=A0A0A0BX47_9CELL|nr:aminotransferase class I/II-fold pyridoxal phosphate-dependent enzyme [Cellulomonas bogoriensis]KGM12988.1 cystathionine gamma-synthase [Cellulomonas bogoriensis 69B4 = DSM 16987]
MDTDPAALSPATIAVTAGRPPREAGAPVNPAVVLSSTFVSSGVPAPGEPLYARNGTASWDPFERALADLEGSDLPAVVMGSGMAAIDAALSLVPRGGRVVMPRHSYQMSLALAQEQAQDRGWQRDLVDVEDTDQVLDAVRGADGRGPASVLWLESPTNPMLEVADLPALVAGAHEAGALVVVDNTFATPLGQRPLDHGADLVVHSVTKYLAGHSDVVLGALVTTDPRLREHVAHVRTVRGAVPGPWDVWLALRGMRTLALRVERSQASAAVLAARLAEHPAVEQVRHPSLPTDPGHRTALRVLRGFGSVVALRPRGGQDAADALVDAVRLWVPATSLGGVESTLERRRRFPTESATVPADLVRLSVGVEDVEDLWRDLDRALAEVAPT